MRQSTINNFPFMNKENDAGELKRVGGIRGHLPGAFQVFAVRDLDGRQTDEQCGYAVYFVPTQSVNPREGAKVATGVLQLVRSIFADDGALTADGKPVVEAHQIVGAPLVNGQGFPVLIPVANAAKWRDSRESKAVLSLIEAAKRNFGSHADSSGFLCYGSGMPEAVTRPVFIRKELDAAKEHAKRYGQDEKTALENCRYVLKQRKDKKAPHATWDRYLSAKGEIVGAALPEVKAEEVKAPTKNTKKAPTKKG